MFICIHLIGALGAYDYASNLFPFFLSVANCTGSEEHLMDCPNSGLEYTVCSYVAVVFCAGIDNTFVKLNERYDEM